MPAIHMIYYQNNHSQQSAILKSSSLVICVFWECTSLNNRGRNGCGSGFNDNFYIGMPSS